MSEQKRARLTPWIGGLALMALIALTAVPSLAASSTSPDKIFSLEVAPNDGAPSGGWTSANYLDYRSGPVTSKQQGFTFTVSTYNRTPGNSNFSSFDVMVPSDFVLKDASKAPSSNVNNSYAVSYPTASGTSLGTVVRVTGLNAVKNGQFAAVYIKVDVNPTSSCSSVDSEPWSAVAYAGNISTTTFRLLSDDPGDQYTQTQGVAANSVSHWLNTEILPNCGIAFVNQPAETEQGQVIKGTDGNDLAVGVYRNGVLDTSAAGTISLAIDSPSTWTNNATISGNGASTVGSVVAGEATFPNLTIADLDNSDPTKHAAGTYTLKATYSEGAATATSDSFLITDTQLCPGGSYTEVVDPNTGQTLSITLNGDNCAGVTVTGSSTDTSQRFDAVVSKKNPTDKITGIVDWTWIDPPQNTDGSLPWTEVHWEGMADGVYVPLALCNVGVDPDTNFAGLFPAGSAVCLLHSELQVTDANGTPLQHVKEVETVAFDVDLSGTKTCCR